MFYIYILFLFFKVSDFLGEEIKNIFLRLLMYNFRLSRDVEKKYFSYLKL